MQCETPLPSILCLQLPSHSALLLVVRTTPVSHCITNPSRSCISPMLIPVTLPPHYHVSSPIPSLEAFFTYLATQQSAPCLYPCSGKLSLPGIGFGFLHDDSWDYLKAESLTGIKNPILAGRELIDKGVRVKWVIIKMGAKGSMLITKSSISCAPAFMVNVVDTVGCGDSYTAAIAYGFLYDMPPLNTLALANAVGAATATGCGAGRNVATMAKVMEILRQSNLNEDYEFWTDLINTKPELEEISLLLTTRAIGSGGSLVHVPLQTVISQLITKFESMQLNRKCCHESAEQVIEATEVDYHRHNYTHS